MSSDQGKIKLLLLHQQFVIILIINLPCQTDKNQNVAPLSIQSLVTQTDRNGVATKVAAPVIISILIYVVLTFIYFNIMH